MKNLGFKILVTLVVVTSIACTQKRDPKLPDGADENIYSIQELEAAVFEISASTVKSKSLVPQKNESEVEVSSNTPKLNGIFKGLKGTQSAEGYQAKIKVTPYYVEVYEIVKSKSQINNSIQSLIERDKTTQLVPVFAFPLQGFGKLVRAKNNLNQETSILRMKQTEWNQATHVQVNLAESSRQLFALDEQTAEKTFEIESFNDAAFSHFHVKLSDEAEQILRDRKYVNFRRVVSTTANEKLKVLLSDLYLPGQKGESYNVIVKTTRTALVGYRVLDTNSQLQSFEKSLVVKIDGKNVLPLFQIPYKQVGRLTRAINTAGYKMADLIIQETDWTQATHVTFSVESSSRQLFALDSNEDLSGQVLLTKAELEGRIVKVKDLHNLLGISIDLAAEEYVRLKLFDNEIGFFHITNLNDSQITEKLRRDYLRKAVQLESFLVACKPDALKLKSNAQNNPCVEFISFTQPVQMSQVYVPRGSSEGTLGSELKRRQVNKLELADLIVVNPGQGATRYTQNDISTENFIPVESARNKQYMFRRTLMDTPNKLNVVIPGMKGQLEIVKFDFTENQVLVKRVDLLNPDPSATDVDNEVIISLPVRYVVETNNTNTGSLTPNVQFLPSHPQAPGVIAIVDWTKNDVSDVATPMAYFAAGQCFVGSKVRVMEDMDNRLNNGTSILNFTLTGTYSLNPRYYCSNQWLTQGLMHYWVQSQANYTVKERVSFKEYDAESDVAPIGSIPYNQQRALGFGFFTFDKKNPNEFNNVGRDDTLTPVMMMHDFRKGKVVDYTLVGLPANRPALNKLLIAKTERVIAQWNNALRVAFAGTELERNGVYIRFKVGNADDGKHFGDLDRNQIQYIDKAFEMGVLGMINPTANPRSGIMEASDVMIYGGNLRAAAEYYRRMVTARKNYKENMRLKSPDQPQAQGGLIPVTSGDAGSAAAIEFISPSAEAFGELKGDESLLRELAKGTPLTSLDQIRPIPLADAVNLPVNIQDLLKSPISSLDDLKAAAFWGVAINELAKAGELTDRSRIDGKLSKAFLANLDSIPGLSTEEKQSMRLEVEKLAYIQSVKAQINAGPQVLEEMPDNINAEKFLTMNVDEITAEIYESTLSHELGHTLGLRHNFMGSYDKHNWHFSEADKAKGRNYSSIMEYLPDYEQTFEGPGPYDVYALRAGYTGKLAKAEPQGPKDFLNIEDALAQTGKTSWRMVTSKDIQSLKHKRFAYCSDEDVPRIPICKRHDTGTNPSMIVKHMVDNYHQMYSLANMRDGRVYFNNYGLYGYIRRIIMTFVDVRQFLDYGFYRINDAREDASATQANGGLDIILKSDATSYMEAATRGREFFHSIVRTPEASRFTDLNERFFEYKTDRRYMVEKKWTRDIFESGIYGDLKVRGIEFDKMFALWFLTMRSLGVPEYDQAMVRVSYVDLEKVLSNGSSIGLPTMNLITQALGDHIQPGFLSPTGDLVMIGDGKFHASASEYTQLYAALAAMLNLDTMGIQADDNFSSQFRFGNSIDKATDESDYIVTMLEKLTGSSGGNEFKPQVLTALGEYPSSPTVVKYWAFDKAFAADQLFRKAADFRLILENEKLIVDSLVQYFNNRIKTIRVQMGVEQGIPEQTETVDGRTFTALEALAVEKSELKERINKDFLAKFPVTVGTREVEELMFLMDEQLKHAIELDALIKAKAPDAELVKLVLDWQMVNMNWVKNKPIAHYAFMALSNDHIEIDRSIKNLFPLIYDQNEGIRHFAQVFMNIKFLNMALYEIHRELR